VIVLDEVDYGVGRTLYRNFARDLASPVSMNYVYGIEFMELNPIYLIFALIVLAMQWRNISARRKELHS
jgi:hypothetical protein